MVPFSFLLSQLRSGELTSVPLLFLGETLCSVLIVYLFVGPRTHR